MTEALRIAWFSDLKQKEGHSCSLSSYVSKLLLPNLMQSFEIELFSGSNGTFASNPVKHFLTAFREHKRKAYDLFFYQFEDSQSAFFSRAHLGLCPGIVWFHDFFLTNDGPEPLLNSPWEDVVVKFNNPALAWPLRGKEYVRPRPQAFREAAFSFVPLFSSQRDHGEYRRIIVKRCEIEQSKSFFLPVPVESLAGVKMKQLSRRILFCGSPRIEHRAHKLFEGLKDSSAEWTLVWLLDEEERIQAQTLLDEYGISNVELHSPRSPEKFAALLPDAQVAAHLHFSVYSHLYPYLPLSLRAGLPCVVSDFAASALLSDKVALKVEPGETEAHQLTMLFNQLESSGGLGSVAAASEYGLEMHDPKTISQELAEIFRSTAPVLAPAMKEWRKMEIEARRALLEESIGTEEADYMKDSLKDLGWLAEGER